MNEEDIENLVGILADQAEHIDGYLKDLARRANLPKKWLGEITWKGAPRLDAKELITTAWDKGLNNEDPRFSSLGSILYAVLDGEDVGYDKGAEIAILIVRYNLYEDENLLRQLKEDKNLIEQLNKKYCIQTFDYFTNKPYLTNSIYTISTPAWKNLESILEKMLNSEEEEEDKFFAVREACRKTLPRAEQHYALTIDTVEQVLKRLDNYIPRDGVTRIVEFAFHLTKDEKIDEAIRGEIETWFETYHFKKPNISNQERQSFLEPRLFIWIEEKCAKAEENQFSVQAWLVPDSPWFISDPEVIKKTYKFGDYYKIDLSHLFSIFQLNELLEKKGFSEYVSPNLLGKINKNISQGATKRGQFDLSLEELKGFFSLLVGEALFLLLQEKQDLYSDNLNTDNLSIEVFAPEKLLNTDIDRWTIFDLWKNENDDRRIYPIGTSFKVILRSLERSTKRHTKKMNRREAKKAQLLQVAEAQPWRLKWKSVLNKLNSIPDKDDFEFINQMNGWDDENLRIQLKKRIGVMLGQYPTNTNLLKTIINDEGIPIVLWTRCIDDLTIDQVNDLSQLVHSDYLLHLPERVLNKRSETRSKSCPNSHLGFHLVMLWDDPNRFPPNVEESHF